MPVYVYKCANDHTGTIQHRMLYSTGVSCLICDEPMWRIPQVINTNWGGLSPSQGEYSPAIKAHLATLDQQRDEYAAIHEAHERRTEKEDGKT